MGSLLTSFTFDRNTLKRSADESAQATIDHIRKVRDGHALDKVASNIVGALASYMGVFIKDDDGKYVTSKLGKAFLSLAQANRIDAYQWLLTRSLWRYCVPNGTACQANDEVAAGAQFSLFPSLLGLLTQMQSLPGLKRYLFHEEFCQLFNDDDRWTETPEEVFGRLIRLRESWPPQGRRLLDDLEPAYKIRRDNLNGFLNKALLQTGLFEPHPGSGSAVALAFSASLSPVLQKRTRHILDHPLSWAEQDETWPQFLELHDDDLPREVEPTTVPVVVPRTETDLDALLAAASQDLAGAGLKLPSGLLHRFVASLLTKRFVILTGLSGSGKTKLAQAFSAWMTTSLPEQHDPFVVGAEVPSDRISYFVHESGPVAIVLRNQEELDGATLVTISRALIREWAEVMTARELSENTPAREIREAVAETTAYSSQQNSFETHLKASALAMMRNDGGSEESAESVKIVPVGPDWDSNEQILGYPDALNKGHYCQPANGALDLILRAGRPEHRDRPFFLILDEMNLSHVERYFADFLSVMESGGRMTLHAGPAALGKYGEVPASVALPDNLFVIGTVNIDETTYLFSPKVLDRANTIEFRVPKRDMVDFMADGQELELRHIAGSGSELGGAFVTASRRRNVGVERLKFSEDGNRLELLPDEEDSVGGSDSPAGVLSSDLMKTFDQLANVGAEFGYRTCAEVRRFFYYYTLLAPGQTNYKEVLDAQVMQKLLPKLHGSARKLKPVVEALLTVCSKNELDLPFSREKLERMQRNLEDNGFTSFAEA